MKSLFAGATALALLMPACAMAGAIDGTWKASTDSAQAPKKPEIYLLTKNVYSCKTCTPAFSVPADGNYHTIKGNPYIDAVAIRVASNGITEMDSKNGKTVTTSTTTLSGDGKTGTTSFTDTSASTTPIKGIVITRKVEAGPAGSHPVSGSWTVVGYSGFSDNGLTVSYKTQGDMVMMSTPTGQSYSAKLGGPVVPYKGDPGTDTVQVKMDGKALVETDFRKDKAVSVITTTPSADGKSIVVSVENKLKGNSMTFTAKKQ